MHAAEDASLAIGRAVFNGGLLGWFTPGSLGKTLSALTTLIVVVAIILGSIYILSQCKAAGSCDCISICKERRLRGALADR